ncbi:organic cation transporter protein-like isoform X1 [Stylophora pistillata]|uniref:Organic cation transporter protein n=2 Tax=Stylophora pistillata TaxID=50429 RepID=A0A2B4REN9_STYPI|nr:organic cation transporter protein-like isoform X1 [Stylophora pistillata]PFX15269.1 Organic cation transporter protein [Stylophora pistillata]
MALTTDEYLEKIGSFGRYQILLLVFLNGLIFFWFGWPVMIPVFITAEPPWRCVANSSVCQLNGTMNSRHPDYKFRCNISRDQWEFVDDFTSVVTEFDLVCERGLYGTIGSSMIFVGFFFGGIVVGPFSDKFGRKITMYLSGLILSVMSLLAAFPEAFWIFALLRCLIGFGIGGYSIAAYVLLTELVGIRHRSTAGCSIWYSFNLSNMALAGLAYLVRDWRKLSIIMAAPAIPFVLGWFFTPESVRWFLVKGKTEKAEQVLYKVAKFNKKPIPQEPLQDCEKQRLGDLRDLFKTRAMTHKTLISWYCWFVNGMVYYGVSYSSPFVGGNVYLNFFITSTVALVAYPALAWGCNRFGRKKTICCGLFFSALGSFGSVVLTLYDDGESKGILAGKIIFSLCIAKFFIVFAFDGFYVYSAELFPTVFRNVGMGTSTSAARVGSFLSTYIVYSQRVHKLLPFGIMGLNALIAGILCMTLPETRDQPTMEVMETTEEGQKMELLAHDDEKGKKNRQ